MSGHQAAATGTESAGAQPPDAGLSPARPVSARDRWRQSLRKLRFTRDGVFYVVFTLGVGLAALNTGNNLLFLILGLLLSTIIISGILAESALRGVSVRRHIERDPVAGEPFLVTYRLTNHKRAWPSLALTVEEVEEPILASSWTPPGSHHRGTKEAPEASRAAKQPETGRLSQNNGADIGQASKNSGPIVGQASKNGAFAGAEAATSRGPKRSVCTWARPPSPTFRSRRLPSAAVTSRPDACACRRASPLDSSRSRANSTRSTTSLSCPDADPRAVKR